MARSIAFSLPFAPSVNGYWRHITRGPLAGRVLISRRGRDYRKAVDAQVDAQRIPRAALVGKLSVWIVVCPPDQRTRDLDNLPKGILDSLKHAKVIIDDSEIDDLRIMRGPLVRPAGELRIQIRELAVPTATREMFAA